MIPLTEEEFLNAIVEAANKPYDGVQKLTYESGPYEVEKLTVFSEKLLRILMEKIEKKNSGEQQC